MVYPSLELQSTQNGDSDVDTLRVRELPSLSWDP